MSDNNASIKIKVNFFLNKNQVLYNEIDKYVLLML